MQVQQETGTEIFVTGVFPSIGGLQPKFTVCTFHGGHQIVSPVEPVRHLHLWPDSESATAGPNT